VLEWDVPWCETCERFLSPSTVRTDGSCPKCGRDVAPGGAHAREGTPEADEPLDALPWHFKLLLGAVTLYLGYRALQGIEWLVAHL